MSCEPLPMFPIRPKNGPGLARIRYRVGTFPQIRRALLNSIDAAPELGQWTHRLADDPGIALLEGVAIVGDILAFYQDVYANEAWLPTAQWRDSITELGRLTGYRLSPGLGGAATFAVEVKGTSPVTIPPKFVIKADLEAASVPAEFETGEESTAWPHLSRFSVYAPRHYGTTLPVGTTRFEIASVGGLESPAALAALELTAGDELYLTVPESIPPSSTPTQRVKVKSVEMILGRCVVEMEGSIGFARTASSASPLVAYRLGRTWRHFGALAPAMITRPKSDGTGVTLSTTNFSRDLDHECSLPSYYLSDDPSAIGLTIPPNIVPLDSEVKDLALGNAVIVEWLEGSVPITATRLSVVRKAVDARIVQGAYGNLAGPSTWVTLDPALRQPNQFVRTDIRSMRVHETTSPALVMRPLPTLPSVRTPVAPVLAWYGTRTEAEQLAGRRLWFSTEDGFACERTVVTPRTAFSLAAGVEDFPRMWQIQLSGSLAPLDLENFPEGDPKVVVQGNLVDATQGKTSAETPLGNGDTRLTFQTFKIPKSPLTYRLSSVATPPEVPELEVWVAGRLWTPVATFFGTGPKDEVYVVREDSKGDSYVQFGDGETGARLPSGINNVTAKWRVGSGAYGPMKAGAVPSAGTRLDGFKSLTLCGVVGGGAEPEDPSKARMAAPGKVQSLGRLVSLQDYETEVLGIPGVVKCTAAWDLIDGVPGVVLRVLLEAGREQEFQDVREVIRKYQECRGPNRFPIQIVPAQFEYVTLAVSYSRDPAMQTEAVESAIRLALGLAGDEAGERAGLFGLHRRRLGEAEYLMRVEAFVQNVVGVQWCQVTRFDRLPSGEDPATYPIPTSFVRSSKLNCGTNGLLSLHSAQIVLSPVSTPNASSCS